MTRTAREFGSIGIVGIGTMGSGIAEICAKNGYQVVGVELNQETLERGRRYVEHSTGRAVRGGKLSEAEQEELIETAVEAASDGTPGRDRRARGLTNLSRRYLEERSAGES